jgi:hypothetical protein
MRTTLNLDEDILVAAKAIARASGHALGQVVSDLARRGLAPHPQNATEAGLPVFEVSSNADPIGIENVQSAMEDET